MSHRGDIPLGDFRAKYVSLPFPVSKGHLEILAPVPASLQPLLLLILL